MKFVQCCELFGGIELKNHAFYHSPTKGIFFNVQPVDQFKDSKVVSQVEWCEHRTIL